MKEIEEIILSRFGIRIAGKFCPSASTAQSEIDALGTAVQLSSSNYAIVAIRGELPVGWHWCDPHNVERAIGNNAFRNAFGSRFKKFSILGTNAAGFCGDLSPHAPHGHDHYKGGAGQGAVDLYRICRGVAIPGNKIIVTLDGKSSSGWADCHAYVGWIEQSRY